MNILQRFHQTTISSPAAFSEMYENNRLSVFRYIYSLMGGPAEEAEDLTAETFIRAWKSRHTFAGNSEAAIGWLIAIAKRLVIDDHRRKEVRKAADLPSYINTESTTEEEILLIQQKQELLGLLQKLPPDQREIIVLRYMLGWKVNQIADHVGITENHVSVIIHRILADLREQWAF